MRSLLASAAVAVGLAGCGNAESIDPAEIDAENVRREEARAVEVVDAAKEREANVPASVSDPIAQAVTTDAAPEGGQSPDPGANVTPPEGE